MALKDMEKGGSLAGHTNGEVEIIKEWEDVFDDEGKKVGEQIVIHISTIHVDKSKTTAADLASALVYEEKVKVANAKAVAEQEAKTAKLAAVVADAAKVADPAKVAE